MPRHCNKLYIKLNKLNNQTIRLCPQWPFSPVTRAQWDWILNPSLTQDLIPLSRITEKGHCVHGRNIWLFITSCEFVKFYIYSLLTVVIITDICFNDYGPQSISLAYVCQLDSSCESLHSLLYQISLQQLQCFIAQQLLNAIMPLSNYRTHVLYTISNIFSLNLHRTEYLNLHNICFTYVLMWNSC